MNGNYTYMYIYMHTTYTHIFQIGIGAVCTLSYYFCVCVLNCDYSYMEYIQFYYQQFFFVKVLRCVLSIVSMFMQCFTSKLFVYMYIYIMCTL